MDRHYDHVKRRRFVRHDLSPLELWLLRYHDATEDEKLCTERIGELESYAERTTRRITGMPSGQGNGEVIPRLSDERSKLKERVKESQSIRAEISEALAKLPPELRRMMEAYYVDGKSWEKAAETVPCHPNYVPKLREKALQILRRHGYNGAGGEDSDEISAGRKCPL